MTDLPGETRRWLDFARQDLQDAEILLDQNRGQFHNVCFLSQQCTERALKAVLIWNDLDVPFRHDLAYLYNLLPTGWEVPQIDWRSLTEWATIGRYPGELPEPDQVLARGLVQQSRLVLKAVEAEVHRRNAG